MCVCVCGGPAHLVGVLQDQVLALLQLAADVDDTAQDAPGVLHAQVDLAGKLVGLELLGAQDDVASRVLHVVTGHVPAGREGGRGQLRDWRGGYASTIWSRLCFSSPQLQVLCVCVCVCVLTPA